MTADAIAQRAGVSKATIYKWWPNKSLVALDAYLAGMTEQVADAGYRLGRGGFYPATEVGDGVLHQSRLAGSSGQFIAEGQSDPGFLALFRERFLYARRDAARVMWRRGVDRGEIREEIDGEIVLDLIYGPMVFRLLAGHGSLSDRESEAMVEAVFGGLRRSKYRRRARSNRNDSVRKAAVKRRLNLVETR